MSDRRFPAREECVLGPMLERRARQNPDHIFAVFENGTTWTYRETLEEAYRTARALRELGVEQGDRVLCWLPNSGPALRVWFGANFLGAVFVPLNLSYRGRLLEHALRTVQPKVAIVHADLVDRLADVDRGHLEKVAVLPGLPLAREIEGVELLDATATRSQDASPIGPERPVQPWDAQTIILTSGTTGPSKCVLSSYLHLSTSARAGTTFEGQSPDQGDRFLVNFPLFHIAGTLPTYSMLIHGASIALAAAFDTKSFWDVVRQTGATRCWLNDVMATFLLKQSPRPDDADSPMRMVTMTIIEETDEFRRRFGVDVTGVFNQTEASMPLVTELNPRATFTVGRVREGVEVRIVDDFDREVPVGQTGELIIRTDAPWSMMTGYYNMPEATAAAWRNGWLHTGDALRRDEDGNFFFVDRLKDCIRRRGENISSMEVEEELIAYPPVRQAAAVAVPGEHGEDEVLAAVSPQPGETVDPLELTEFLVPRMPHFMVPRYVRVLEEMPMTPSNKIRKFALRDEGVTPDTWDREAAGLQLKRDRLAPID